VLAKEQVDWLAATFLHIRQMSVVGSSIMSQQCALFTFIDGPLKIYCTVVILKETQDSLVLKCALLSRELLFHPVFHYIV